MIYFGVNLRLLRKKKNLTLAQIASTNGMKGPAWNNYELGTSYPKFEDLVKIAKYFEVPLDTLIFSNLAEHTENINDRNIKQDSLTNDLRTIIEAKDKIIRLQDDKIFQLQNELKENIKKADRIKNRNRGKTKYA